MMKLDEIRVASNGYVLMDRQGDYHIASTLGEAAKIVGETYLQSYSEDLGVVYAKGHGRDSLVQASIAMKAGRKIDAIKILRTCFTTRLGLLETKELLEVLCGENPVDKFCG
jgi:ribosomal protein L7/L12